MTSPKNPSPSKLQIEEISSIISRFPSNRTTSPVKSNAGLIRRTASDVGQLKLETVSSRNNDFRDGLNTHDIFRGPTSSNDDSNDEKQSRNESSLRLTDRNEDEMGERQQIVPPDRLDRTVIFRRSAGVGVVHSPIGTPREIELGAELEASEIPPIRPSLSCPTSVFESPLFQNCKILASPGVPLDEIRSAENSTGITDDIDALNCTDVSVIEYEEEPSFRICEDSNALGVRNLNDAFELLVVDSSIDDGNNCIMKDDSAQCRADIKIAEKQTTSDTEFSDNSEHKSNSTTTPAISLLSKRSVGSNKPSPTSVFSLESDTSMISTVDLEQGVKVASIHMPHFNLHESLRGELCQGLIDRVSFYSVLRDINKEAMDAAMSDPRGSAYNDGTVHGKKSGVSNVGNAVVAEDGKIHVHPNPEEESRSVLVLAACLAESFTNDSERESSELSSARASTFQNSTPLGAALLDEEWWLLSAVASRTQDEVASNHAAKLPLTFSEAMGEKDDSNIDGKVVASSRTQLWKPGRSWWEAKSGKNPWVEPVVHNNRWRYLWPLIHYHKFIAKCIKKLKRNGVDVKSSTSNVSIFLRQEVCNVSDHLAAMSKFDSEEWTSALSHFDGWTAHDPDVEEVIRNLVASQQLHGLSVSDVQSSLLRSQVDEKFLKAMQAMKDEAAKGGNESFDYSLGAKDAFMQKSAAKDNQTQNLSGIDDVSMLHQSYCTQDSSLFYGTYRGHCPIPRGPNRSWLNDSHVHSVTGKIKKVPDLSGSASDVPQPYPHHSVYGPQYDQHQHFDPTQAPGPFAYHGAHYYPQPHQYGVYDQVHHHHDQNIGYHHAEPGYCVPNDQYGHHYYNGYYHQDRRIHDGVGFDSSLCRENIPYMHSSTVAQTPSRYHGNDSYHSQFPVSPYWGHLNISQLPGLAASPSVHHTPSKPPTGKPNRSYRKRHGNSTINPVLDGKAKSLIMFPNQTNSPASRFVMTPQDSKGNPYYMSTNSRAAPHTSALNHSVEDSSFVLPAIEDYSASSPAKANHTFVSETSMQLAPPEVRRRS